MPTVTLLSDFGTADGFVAAMKGVILGIVPGARLVDAAHDVEPGDVEAAAWVLSQYWNLYPQGVVHLAVVDPGVGGDRRPIALAADGRFVVAPDNGLVSRVLAEAKAWSCVELGEARYLREQRSATFHGRDVFAPAAAHLAAGVPLQRMGPAVSGPTQLDFELPQRGETALRGRIVHVDRFGNLITDIPVAWVGPVWRFRVGGEEVGAMRRSYSDVGPGELVVVPGSMGTVEVAARDASAAERIGVARGDPVSAELLNSRSTG